MVKLADSLKSPIWSHFYMQGQHLTAFSIVGETPVENEMLNISANSLEISFFSTLQSL